MINLALVNGEAFVWNADDWSKLREQHRIVGNLIGTLSCLPRQDSFLGLPLALMPEEVRLLLDHKLAKLVKYDCLSQVPSSNIKEKFEQFRKQSYLEQVEYFQSERKKQITNMVDIIVEGKRRKLLGLSTKKPKGKRKRNRAEEDNIVQLNTLELPDRDALIKQEIDKVVPITEEMALIQTPTECPWLHSEDAKEVVDFAFPETPEEILKSKVFADLWAKGHYITSGHKFGGNFLVYPGDPIKFHAQYIVVCREPHQPMRASELVALGRVGTSVRKSIVIASLTDPEQQEVVYNTIKWTP